MNLSEIGQRVKNKRKKMNMSQEKLAELISVTPHYVYEIERGIKAMSIETLINISHSLNISTDYLLFGVISDSSSELIGLLNELNDERRSYVEEGLLAILPYIK